MAAVKLIKSHAHQTRHLDSRTSAEITYTAKLYRRFKSTSPNARALKQAQMNDEVQRVAKTALDETQHAFISNQSGVNLVRLSKQGTEYWLPRLDQIQSARIICLHTRLRDD